MKKLMLGIIILILAFSFDSDARNLRGHAVNLNYFYYELSSYGEWIELDADLIVWRPSRVNYGWAPYSIGRWNWTNYGWYWDSYEPFGNITYHYGRWIYDDYYGWIWMPDYEWAPAWVEWRYNDNYIGWAPLPPYAEFRIGVGIHFTFNWHPRYYHWRFVNYYRFGSDRVYNYFVRDRQIQRIYGRTKLRTNYDYRDNRIVNRGIDRRYIEKRSRTRVATRDLVFTRNNDASGRKRGNTIRVYEPDEKSMRKYPNAYRTEIKRGNRTSVHKDKIALKRGTKLNENKPVTNRTRKGNNRISKNYSPDRVYSGKKSVNRSIAERGKRNNKKYERNARLKEKTVYYKNSGKAPVVKNSGKSVKKSKPTGRVQKRKYSKSEKKSYTGGKSKAKSYRKSIKRESKKISPKKFRRKANKSRKPAVKRKTYLW